MANINCEACETLRSENPELIVNGFDSDMCTSLQNDTGLKPSLGHDDCEDLNTMNDCLVGNLNAEIDKEDYCDWKAFAHKAVDNLWTLLKAMICAICGLWSNVHDLWGEVNKLWTEVNNLWADNADIHNAIDDIEERVSYISYDGILTLYRGSSNALGDGSAQQTVKFDAQRFQGNIPSGVLARKSDYTGIIVTNTTSVPLLVEATYNSSIRTHQRIACCYTVITRDGKCVGQTPFITPNTYDQQVTAEPFILQPNESAEISYYFGIGSKNTWFQSQFGYESGYSSGEPQCCLEYSDPNEPRNQGSYLTVRVTSIVAEE